jgi:YD repeat-containing protein
MKSIPRQIRKIFNWNILLILFQFSFSFAAPLTYTYDTLNRLTKVTYENGTTEEFTYDSAGNRLSLLVAYETESSSLSITSHINGQHVNSPIVTLCGTASDAENWGNGIYQVLVNGIRANNDTATRSGTANWCIQLTLNPGANTLTIIAMITAATKTPPLRPSPYITMNRQSSICP